MNRRQRRQQEKLRRKTGAPKMAAVPFLELAGQHHRAGRLDDAVVHYRSALEVDPNCVEGHFNLGLALKNLGQLDGAVTHYRKVLKINPGHAKAHNNLGNTLRDQGRPVDAIASYRKAIELRSDYAEAHYNLGVALIKPGRLDEAVEHFETALEIKPDFAQAHNNLGNLLRDLGRTEDSVASYRAALEPAPDYAEAHGNLGNALRDLGRMDEAGKSYDRALEIDPGLDDIRHIRSAIAGETTEIAPAGYVRKLFDFYATRFDDHLVNKLGYEVPSLLRQAVDSLKDRPATFRRALDLGCGTGLVGDNFKDIVEDIGGIDLSPAMVGQARHKDVYDELYVGDLCEVLEGPDIRNSGFDLVLSADTFIYIGNLDPVFAAVGKAMPVGGLFVFSVEFLDRGTYELLPSGRYSHSDGYIGELASDHGFSRESCHRVRVRIDRDCPISGNIYLLRKASKSP